MAGDKQRPPPKNVTVSARVPDEVYAAAKEKAEGRGSTLSKMVRAFLFLFAHDETPPDWPPEIADQEIRAQKRSRKRRK